MEFKTLLAEPRSIDGRTVTGFAAVSGNVDAVGDRIIKGAFKKTIQENGRRVRHLWMHDPYQPPTAVIKSLADVGADELPDRVREEYPEATGGLMVTREYLETPRGDEILEGIKAGAISEMSFGFDPIKFDFDEIENKQPIRNLREIRLWDISDVTWGANSATVTAKADLPDGEEFAEYKLNELKSCLAYWLQPEAIKEGRVLSSRNLSRLRTALETLNEILLAAEPPEDDEKLLALTEQTLMRLAIAEREIYLIGA